MNTIQQQTTKGDADVIYLLRERSINEQILTDLQRTGYRVKTTFSVGETVLCLRMDRFAALIVGPLVPSADKALLSSELSRRQSKVKTVILYRDQGGISLRGNAIIDIRQGSRAVVSALSDLLSPDSNS